MNLREILENAVEHKASDVHIKVGNIPMFRVYGEIQKSEFGIVRKEECEDILKQMNLSKMSLNHLYSKRQIDVGYGIEGLGRFRTNIFFQRGNLSFAFRFIPFNIPSLEDLHLPIVLKDIVLKHRGFVLVAGVTGSGKTTTLASMLEVINTNAKKHIITIEDPIEYLYKDKMSIVSQRQVGDDVLSFYDGLKYALREDPDIILVGEMRDKDTIKVALEAVETGHLVFSTVHTLNSIETINRIITSFSSDEQKQIRLQFANTVEAIISQRLIRRSDKKGMVPAVELVVATEFVRESILDSSKTREIIRFVEMNKNIYGTQSFDQSLVDLYKNGLITMESVLSHSAHPSDLQLKMRGIE